MSDASRTPFDRKIRVGVTEKNQHPYWDLVNAGWHDAAERLGMDVRIDAPESEDVDAQLALMRDQLASGVDVLAFVATRVDAFAEIVADARHAGVPTVAFDLDAPDSGRLLFVGMPGLRESGGQLGDFLAERIPRGATVIAQTGSDQAPGARGKLDGFLESMARHGNHVVVGESDGEDVAKSLAVAQELLEAHPDAAGMFGGYGYHPAVQARAAKLCGADVTIVGYDMLPETVELLEQGTVAASLWIQEYYFGYLTGVAVNSVVRAGSTEILPLFGMDPDRLRDNAVYPPTRLFTPQTVHEFRAFAKAKALGERTRVTTV